MTHSGAEEEFLLETEETKRTKLTEGAVVLQMQTEAVDRLKILETRKFKLSKVPIITIGGSKMWVNGWIAKTAPLNQSQPLPTPESGTTCDICQREFLDKRRLAIHKNVHLKTSSKS
ncbi:hypothetical protein NEHOM01_1433 [Nematocida homosporus]|uniref:uncharacterized protein n=1 Tax=Nematocida homosporus TaxID=1912981 RepID=UPI00221E8AC4|nr:uncharacterized protein NEHOM01_1433 [Nematocida homosporus]KAI5186379.1 hypothetical protein NEHOM01_1433 [Nematocida homosporus]